MFETGSKKIFDYLSSDFSYHTLDEVAKAVELNHHAVRKYISDLNACFSKYQSGATIESKTSKGYKFVISDRDRFTEFLRKEWYKYAFYEPDYNDRDYRILDTMREFFKNSEFVKQEDLSEKYSLSLSQIKKDIKHIRNIFKKYNLEISFKPHYGMTIEGDEKDIRRCIKYELGIDKNNIVDEGSKLYEDIERVVDEYLKSTDLRIPYEKFKSLVSHIFISVLRIREKQYIEFSENSILRESTSAMYHHANNLASRIEKLYNVEFTKEEVIYIAIHLRSKNVIENREKISSETLNLCTRMIEKMYELTKFDLRSNVELFFSLATHLGPLVERIKYGLSMKNPLLKEIKKFPVSYNLAAIASGVINDEYLIQLSEDEIAYIALHIFNAFNNQQRKKKKILIVCSSNKSYANILRSQLEIRFFKEVEVIDCIDLSEITEFIVKQYDIIINMIDKVAIPFAKNTVYLDMLLDSKSIESIEAQIYDIEFDTILKIFDDSVLIRNFQAKDKEEVIDKLALIANEKTGVRIEKIKEELYLREELGSVSFENNLATPHPLTPISDSSFFIIMILKNKIKWDNKDVSLIISLFVGKEQKNMNLFYKKMGVFLSDKKALENALKSQVKEDFINLFLGR